ncbi:MAG: hypothetical protein HY812_11835 [Planctomycetes bacterium]|nr:hypothetical protein [Planctomycetota bacterium]
MNMRFLARIALLALLASTAACHVFPMTVAPSTVPLAPGEYTELGPASGSSTGFYVFFVPVSTRSSVDAAIAEAMQERGGDALVNVTADVTMTYLIFVNFITTRVYGIAVKVEEGEGG